MTIATIVVATDGSENSARAVAHAADVARACAARVVALHVFEPLALLGRVKPPVDFAAQEEATRRILQDEWCAPLRAAGVEFEARLVENTPADGVLDVAAEVGADLIVVGARGLSRLKELVLGSTSTTVLHRARCPVTVVPPTERVARP